MLSQLAADAVLILHLLFILFALFGGLLVLHRRRWMWLHLPAVLWGVWVEWAGKLCPLTPLENHFRHLANGQGYEGGFVQHYLLPLIYPAGLTPTVQLVLGAVVIAVNLLVYGWVFWWKWHKCSSP
ncbi:MAG: DUF2784 domain-containing protein [Desulfuromonadales bacterium]|nr:DUF2784 domain-containing protein [Desulfuromonadales bacterium]